MNSEIRNFMHTVRKTMIMFMIKMMTNIILVLITDVVTMKTDPLGFSW